MGRVTYKVKNTFVEFGAPGDHQDFECRGRRALSSEIISQDAQGLQQPEPDVAGLEAMPSGLLASPALRVEAHDFIPATPSPLMHPALMPSEMMAFGLDHALPPAAFDTGGEGFQCLPGMDSQELQCLPGMESQELQCLPGMDSQEMQCLPGMDSQEMQCLPGMESQELQCLPGMDSQEMQEMCIPAMAYDPNSGWCSGWCMPAAAYNSMGCQDLQDMSQWEYMGQEGMEAIQDMCGEFQDFREPQEGAEFEQALQHEQDFEHLDLQGDFQQVEQAYPEGSGGDPEGSQGSDERPHDDFIEQPGVSRVWGKQQQLQQQQQYMANPGTYTTVMLRNVPNKYTREMLVDQLNRDFRGRFDFVYLPIDFKNGCNIGYGFINFRTVEACAEFVDAFDGVDVCRCLPGLHSRKVAEVTPARVQGLEENVRRLRGSPVMGELSRHPEWMPLLLGEDGEEVAFPQPEQPVPPVRPRSRRGREAWATPDRGERSADRSEGHGARGRGAWRR